MTCSCIYFLEPYTIFSFFLMCFVLLTINLCFFFFHKYSLNCMAFFFLSLLMMIFFHKYSLECTALFLDIHVVLIDNFIS